MFYWLNTCPVCSEAMSSIPGMATMVQDTCNLWYSITTYSTQTMQKPKEREGRERKKMSKDEEVIIYIGMWYLEVHILFQGSPKLNQVYNWLRITAFSHWDTKLHIFFNQHFYLASTILRLKVRSYIGTQDVISST